jgi:hypothetical protein
MKIKIIVFVIFLMLLSCINVPIEQHHSFDEWFIQHKQNCVRCRVIEDCDQPDCPGLIYSLDLCKEAKEMMRAEILKKVVYDKEDSDR